MQNNNPKIYTISEFGLIGIDENVVTHNKFLSAQIDTDAYKDFEAFAKTENGNAVLHFTANGKYLQARNYIGIIQTKSNYILEILPKTLSNNKEHNIIKAKILFTKLLNLVHKLPTYKNTGRANLEKHRNTNIFEIFISMFLNEVGNVIQKGLKAGYVLHEENSKFFKGKLLEHHNIKHNLLNKHKFYVQYDEFNQNLPENRLIKATLLFLLKLSQDYNNLRRIRIYLEHMSMVNYSQNIDQDIRSIHINRGMEHYKNTLLWAKIFLKKESFSSFSGRNIALAILYPMEKIFEHAVELWLKKSYTQYTIKPQSIGHSFVNNLFSVRPDFLIQSSGNTIAIADAKWKLVNSSNELSQGDFYQLFAYKQIFMNKNTAEEMQPTIPPLQVIYPKSEYLVEPRTYRFFDGDYITLIPLDIENELM